MGKKLANPELEGFDETPVGGWAMHSYVDSYDPNHGTTTKYHFQDDSFIVEKLYDPEPYLREAAEARATESSRWGDGFVKIGSIPQAVLSGFQAQGLTDEELSQRCVQWLKENPLMCHTDKLRKDADKGRIIV